MYKALLILYANSLATLFVQVLSGLVWAQISEYPDKHF